jgi:hypothetical protein
MVESILLNYLFACKFFIYRNKLSRRLVNIPVPRISGDYIEDHDYFIQVSSGRKYKRYAYICFEGFSFFRFTKYRNTDSWKTFNRLYSYSSHILAYDMPLLMLFNYSSMYTYRDLNRIELELFHVSRTGQFGREPIIVTSLYEFKKNLNTRFSFSSFEASIDFSLFILAGELFKECSIKLYLHEL